METHTLIVGGTSGLGLELARNMAAQDEPTIITGRHDPKVNFAEYREFDLNTDDLPGRIGEFVLDLPPIKALIYAAGFYQEGRITDLSDKDVDTMINVGGRGLIFFTKKLLEKQDKLDELVTITSTSQWTPREFEPVYNYVKAGAGHYSHGQSLDPRVRKTLVVGTSGMATEFWDGIDKDTSQMMLPEWVAQQVMNLRQKDDTYIFAKILGAFGDLPKRVEIEHIDRAKNEPTWAPEPGGTTWRILQTINEAPHVTNEQLAVLIGCSESQISRSSKKLADAGYVEKMKAGRMNLWETTYTGNKYLEATVANVMAKV